MPLEHFLLLESWSVEYYGKVFDDARCADDGTWYFCDFVTHEICAFPDNAHVVKICKNP